MSESTEIDDVEWENVARRIFYECLASSSSSSSISSFTSLPSTTSRITVKTLVDFIRNNALGNSRNKFLLDELEKSIAEVSWDGQVNYTLFKKASRRWVMKIQNNGIQDGNNNISKDDSSDDFLGRSDDEKQNSVDSSDNDRDFGSLRESCGQSKTPRKLTTADFVDLLNVSSYSPSSDMTHGCAMSDTTPESADEADSGCGVAVGIGEISQVDLRLRVRRFDEENALLREELVRAEELAAGLERQLENLRRKLEHAKEKCRQLERENDEHQEMLNEAEQKERDCRWALQKAEKERSSLTRKLEDAEAERQQVAIFSTKLERCKKEKYDCMREFTVCQRELEEKQRECELLKEQLAQITETNKNLQESYDKTIQRLREKIQELKKEKFILHTPELIGNSSDPICTTPPIGYLHSYMQSTPYSDKGVKMHDSLYDELKASGFSLTNESRIRELEDELCSYNEEIRYVIRQINNVMEQLCHTRSMPYVPDLNLEDSNEVKSSEISVLLEKISELSNTVNEIIWKPKVKDASTQLCADSFYTDERLSSQYGIPLFEDNLELAREKSEREASTSREDSKLRLDGNVFGRTFSMNSRLLGEYVEEVETAIEDENYRDINNFSSTFKGSVSTPPDIQEHTIIDPIVEELDRILECTNKLDEETTPLNSSPSKNPKYRCIYTCAQPSSNFRGRKIDDSTKDSTLISPKCPSQDLAATYVVKSGGDGFSFGKINHKTQDDKEISSIEPMVKTNSLEDTDTFEADSMTESMLKSGNLEQTTDNEKETASRELFVCTEIRDKIPKNRVSSISTSPESLSKPRKIDDELNGNETSHCATPVQNSRLFPKRKISVFHRSFDIHTQEGEKNNGGSDTYRLTERSISTPIEIKDKNDDDMELDPECMKMTLDKGKVLLNYRTKMDDSDSSDSLSPLKSIEVHQHENSSIETVEANQRITKKLNLAPTKLKLPMPTGIPAFGSFQKKLTTDKSNDDAEGKILENPRRMDENRDSIANVTQETDVMKNVTLEMDSTKNETTYDGSKIEDAISTKIQENSSTMEIIRPGDEIERGVTFRKAPNSRESGFSDYSLLSSTINTNIDDRGLSSKLGSVSKVVLSFEDESTSCDSSPKREPSIVEITPTLASNYEKREIGGRLYSREDPTKCRVSSWQDRSTEAGSGYQTRNDGTNVTSYGGSEGVVGLDEKVANIRTPAVGRAMSSGEDSSDSECDPMAIRREDNDRRNVVNETRTISPNVGKFVNGAFLVSSTPATSTTNIIVKNDVETIECETRNGMTTQKRDKRERTIRRSLSESGCGRSECRRHLSNDCSPKDEFTKEETRPTVFPSLTDIRLQESGIANIRNDEIGKNLPEADLERKYTALSIGVVTDRVTLPRRMALSIRQRDQSERNLACEVYKMHQDIQDLAPLCRDRESVERVERVRHQLEMITQCAHRVSCTAETLGAVHQEHRISRAVLLADRYLLILRSRCEKLALDLAETKRILTENNIVVEEHNGELGDDMPRIRYRGMPTNNRTMMARRRASIATIFRPLGNFQDVTKDGLRQRNSVSGRVTLRRPSLTAESQKWEVEKLDRTDSSSSIGELREIFEQAESRRNSREENNNNVLRLHSSNLNVRDCENSESDVWTSAREEITSVPELSVDPTGCQDSTLGHKTSLACWSTSNHFPWKTIIWCIVISFFFGFYVNHAVSSVNECTRTHFKWWSIEEIAERYLPVKNNAPRPI